MREFLKQLLVCPHCRGGLKHAVFEERDEGVVSGVLWCVRCRQWFPVFDSIPRMLPVSLWPRNEFVRTYGDQLRDAIPRFNGASRHDQNDLHDLQTATQGGFGFEWDEYSRFG